MLEKNNMVAIRALAKEFLNFKVAYSEYGIEIHPYNVRGEEGTPRFEKWKSDMTKMIDTIDKVETVLFIMHPAWHMMFLQRAKPYLSRETFIKCFASSFIEAEYPTLGSSVPINDLVDMFKECGSAALMDKDERKAYKRFPNMVRIYRGIGFDEEKHLMSLSWTLQPKIAEMFASRTSEQGKVYTAVIEKKHILAYFDRRKEEEIIVDPKYLKDITLYKDLSI